MFTRIIGWLIGLAMFAFSSWQLITAPKAYTDAKVFNKEAKQVTAKVLNNEVFHSKSGNSTTTWNRVTASVEMENGSTQIFELDSSSEPQPGDTVQLWLYKDKVYWDNSFSAYWHGPFQKLAVGSLLFILSCIILYQQSKPYLGTWFPPRKITISVSIYGDSKSDLKDTIVTDAQWEKDDRLFIVWRDCRYPVRCGRCENNFNRPEAWILKEDRIKEGDKFYIFYDD